MKRRHGRQRSGDHDQNLLMATGCPDQEKLGKNGKNFGKKIFGQKCQKLLN